MNEIVDQFFEYYGTSFVVRGNFGTGHPAIPPQVPTKVLLFSYMNGVYSSRVIEKRTHVALEYMYLCEKYELSYRTIARFRCENKKLFREVFVYFITILKKHNMLNYLALFTDSTKIKANASDDSYLTKEELELYKELIEDAMKLNEVTDKEEEKLNKIIEKKVDKRSVKKIKKKVREIISQIKQDKKEKVEEKDAKIAEKLKK
ncbi:MAG: transposase [Candidatus Thermoplasmatota archaeon]